MRVKSNPALSHHFLKDSKLNPNTTNHSRTLSSLLVCTLISTWLLEKISLPLIGCSNFFRWWTRKKGKKTSHTVSPECADLHQTTELWWVNLRMQLFVASIYDQMEEEFSNRLRQLYSRKYRVQQISAHICDSGGGFDGWKKYYLAVSLIGSTWFLFFIFYFSSIFFCHRKVLPVFKLTHFDWLLTHFRKCSDTQLISGTF